MSVIESNYVIKMSAVELFKMAPEKAIILPGILYAHTVQTCRQTNKPVSQKNTKKQSFTIKQNHNYQGKETNSTIKKGALLTCQF